MTDRRAATKAVLAVVFVAGTAAETHAADTFRQLKEREITARFAGMEFTDEVHFAHVFKRDGTLSAISTLTLDLVEELAENGACLTSFN